MKILSETASKAIEFYGGKELWNNNKFITANVSVKGLAFILKRRPFFKNANIVAEIGKPFSMLTPIGKNETLTGVLDGNNVMLKNNLGEIVSVRNNARDYFPLGRRLLYWDDLDMTYFANYAFWNYFTFPKLLMNESIDWIEKERGVLVATFPDSLPTHCKVQEFIIDYNTGKLKQHNYAVDIISKYAKVANVTYEHSTANGINFASSRVVTPRSITGNVLKKPVMIDMKIHDFKLVKEI